MKRKLNCVADNTRSKRPRIYAPLEYKRQKREIVCASHLYNYMIGDPLVDWLKLSNRRGTRGSPAYTYSSGFSEFIKSKGLEFEREIIKYINENRISVVSVSEYINFESLCKTKELMYKGVPIIHSAPVKNYRSGTQGIIDLLVRSDYLNILVEENPLSSEEIELPAPKLINTDCSKPYHYVVVDIKFSTLPLRADGIHLLNSGSYPAYKAQCLIYTEAIGLIQGFTAPHAFILGRRWNYTKKGIVNHNYTCLNKLGKISYDTVDLDYKRSAKEAVKWIRDVKKYGSRWNLYPPSRVELFPNMCVDSGYWNNEKVKIADNIGEITSIWNIGVKNRNIAIKKGITSWRDVNCNTRIMNLNGSRACIIDAIMDINRQNVDKIRPVIIKSNMYDWKREDNELYVDFETLSDIFTDFNELPDQSCTGMIFMIGVGWSENGIWNYKNYICRKPTYEEEYRIMDEFANFVFERGNPKIYYWCAESRFWNCAENRQFNLANIEIKNHISNNWKFRGWSDLYKLFQSEPIVIKDCFKFGLKAIAKAMRKHDMISAHNDSVCEDGMSAMINAWKIYRDSENPINSDTMKDISKYNEWDVKVLWEIITYLRTNHV